MPAAPSPPAALSPAATAAMAASAVGLLSADRASGPLLAITAIAARQPPRPDSPRMTRLKQLQFDRRPSTTLKAWAHKPPPKSDGPAKDALQVELDTFQKNVTLGNWQAVKVYLAKLPASEGMAGYRQLLQSLQAIQPMQAGMPGPPGMVMGPMGPMPRLPELNAFNVDDVIGLAAAAPFGLDPQSTTSLGAILRRALDGHTVASDAMARFKVEVDRGTGKAALSARQAAQVLMAAGEPISAGAFLPGLDQANADKDAEALNLLSRHFLGLYGSEKKVVLLERAWSATQAVLALESAKVEEKEEALRRAVELAPRIKDELGQVWLSQSYTTHPERGMLILATIGALASQGLDTKPMQRDERFKVLQLQKTAVEALLKAAPERAAEWQSTLTLLASVWIREAAYTRQMDHTGPRMRRDPYGRVVWVNDDPYDLMMMRQQNQPMPIRTADVLAARPGPGWIAKLDGGRRAKLAGLLAALFLNNKEEEKAFPYIEEVAPTDKQAAHLLVNEFLRIWTANHDLNASRQDNYNPFVYGYWFYSSGNADSIPLTRSKQERNLVDLAGWVERLRRLPLDRLDEDLLVGAFTRCHSRAEVYRLEKIEMIFGPLAKIKPRTLAGLVQTTRSNLAGQWRVPAEQQKQKTNRKQKDIEVEVLRGYALADKVVGDALKQFPDDWSLNLARAALLHDETTYRQEVAKSADYSKKHEQAIAAFQKAAALYADQVRKLAEDEETILVYQQWFNASLGACDLDQVDEEKLPDLRQIPLIRKALLALPAEVAERHMNKMGQALAINLSVVKPTVRHRYLKQGFAIVADNPKAAPAKRVFDFYKDIITEIKLDVAVDGSDRVTPRQPFGVFVNIRHTREIERESGGFGRFLTGAATSGPYGFVNPGRPTADYRERFAAATTEALKEQFEIVSITFQSEKVHSRALPEYGWRVTPYAYLLLKPRGPQVDKIPPLHIDLDFQDTTVDFANISNRPSSGYVILPIESRAVPIDAGSGSAAPRPLRKLQITQVLDERQADKGKLRLEIRATAVGLIGTFDETLKLDAEGFEVARQEDQGVSVAKFDEDGDHIAIVSERNWLVELRASQDHAAAPTTFRFATARVDGAEMVYQRYQDADVLPAESEVTLEHEYQGRPIAVWMWAGGAAALVLLVIVVVVLIKLLRRPGRAAVVMHLPDTITPFTVTALLQRIGQTGNLSPAEREQLTAALGELERCYFAGTARNGAMDLKTLAEEWVRRVR
jgi:hypothetical protein